jgi:type I restriction enzyme S subunit
VILDSPLQTKLSGDEWLGELPSHWEVHRLKWSADLIKNGTWGEEADGGLDDIPCVRVADFDRERHLVKKEIPTLRKVSPSDRVGRVLRRGDLLIEKSGGGELQPVGFVVLYDFAREAVCSNFVARIKSSPQADSRFFRYVHAAAYAARLNVRSIKQTTGIQNLDGESYFNELAPFPPLVEQQTIATYLDRKTAQIDALVAKKQRMIGLLEEERSALINQAVTRGIYPDTSSKDSGVEWLGSIPREWEAKRLKFVCPEVTVGIVVTPAKYYVDEGVPSLRSLNVREHSISGQDLVYISRESHALLSKSALRKGDLWLFVQDSPVQLP